MIMKTKINSTEGGYETPVLEYLDYHSEGVLCQSSPAQGEVWNDGGSL